MRSASHDAASKRSTSSAGSARSTSADGKTGGRTFVVMMRTCLRAGAGPEVAFAGDGCAMAAYFDVPSVPPTLCPSARSGGAYARDPGTRYSLFIRATLGVPGVPGTARTLLSSPRDAFGMRMRTS
jgi:hypothetical protein